MAKQTINLGTSANKGDGDPLRTAFDKVNDNFDEVYGLLGATGGDVDDVVAPMLVHDQHTNVTVTRDDDANLIIFSVDQAVTDLKGTLAGDDSTILVDGVNSSINLDGTVKGNIIPDTDVAYDLGSATNRFRDLYLSGSTIDLGGTTLSVAGGALQIGGTSLSDVVKTALTGGGAGTFTDRLEDEEGNVQQAGLAYTNGSAAIYSAQDPVGDQNTLGAEVNVAGGRATVSATIQQLTGDNFGLVDVTPGELRLQARVDGDTAEVVLQSDALYVNVPVVGTTIRGITEIVSGANPNQYMYISTTSEGGTYTNAAFKYSSALSSPVTEFVGPTVLESIKVGNTIDILYAPTIFADTNPGSGNKIDLTITAGVDNDNTGFKGQLNLGTNNTDTINIGTGGIADTINIGDDTTTTTTINGKLQILSTPPATSKGAADDVPGQVAFDNFYIYYCTDAYVAATWANSATVDVAGGGTGGSGIALRLTTVPSVGWFLSDGTTTAEITQVVPQGDWYVLLFDQDIAFDIGDTVYYGATAPVQADIWKRVPLPSSTW